MNIKNKLIIVLIFTISYLYTNNAHAQQPDHTFNYQGELIDNGVPANGSYDFIIDAYSLETGGLQLGSTSQHLGITLQNGLFNLTNVNVSDTPYDGGEVWLNIAVRPVGGVGFTNLSPRQLLQSVPYASKIANGFATPGQVYTFDNTFGWGPADPVNNSPWVLGGQGIITYSTGKVIVDNFLEVSADASIGTTTNTHRLTVQSDTDNKALRLIGTTGTFNSGARLNFGDADNAYIDEPIDDHLNLHARIAIDMDSNVKQPIDSNGIMKYMVHLSNCGSTSSLITKFSNNVGTGIITVTNGSTAGECIINFPVDISNRYWQSSAIQPTGSRGVTCSQTGVINTQLKCTRFDTTTGTGIAGGGIMLLIY